MTNRLVYITQKGHPYYLHRGTVLLEYEPSPGETRYLVELLTDRLAGRFPQRIRLYLPGRALQPCATEAQLTPKTEVKKPVRLFAYGKDV